MKNSETEDVVSVNVQEYTLEMKSLHKKLTLEVGSLERQAKQLRRDRLESRASFFCDDTAMDLELDSKQSNTPEQLPVDGLVVKFDEDFG